MVKKQRLKLSDAGFSLIEVLVSMLILSLVIYAASLSCSFFLKVWGDTNMVSHEKFQEYRTRHIFRNSVESSMDYMVKISHSLGNESYAPFFEGGKDHMLFVTRSSAFESQKPAICRLSVEKTGDETFQVKYQEKTLDDFILQSYDDDVLFDHELILFEGVLDVRFSYFGVLEKTINVKDTRIDSTFAWQEIFSGRDKKEIPQKIKLEVKQRDNTRVYIIPVRGQDVLNTTRFNPVFGR